ncbi:MAG: acylphosphatase [Alphaproteobacteria bacterium]|nr:acylphosphatase [Rhodospirillales bacterium]MCW9045661.1 acylphosphatase [Alphaproteobacteria bacterium]
MEPTKSVQVRIEGRVQGVWYRGWTVDTATKLGLVGWVRNRFDSSVEAVFSGPSSSVDQMLKACHSGPSSAHVTKVEAILCSAPEAIDFKQHPTN